MSLLEICEPVFGEVCDFNRVCNLDQAERERVLAKMDQQGYDLRATLRARLDEAERNAGADPLLASQFEQVKRPLVYFIDDYVVTCPLFRGEDGDGAPHSQVAEWQERILEVEKYGTEAGGSLFFKARQKEEEEKFDGLDETLKDHRPDAKDRLLVFRTCLGLGFTGLYREEPAKIVEYMTKIRQRLTKLSYVENEDPDANIVPDPPPPLPRPPLRPARWLQWVAAGFVILMAGVFVFYLVQFREGKREHSDILNIINGKASR